MLRRASLLMVLGLLTEAHPSNAAWTTLTSMPEATFGSGNAIYFSGSRDRRYERWTRPLTRSTSAERFSSSQGGCFGAVVFGRVEGTAFAPNQLHGTDLLKVALTALRIDPRLQDNNGPTQTLALLPGSLAVHRIPLNACHVKGISTDQRGVRRPQGVACDIGAYELLG